MSGAQADFIPEAFSRQITSSSLRECVASAETICRELVSDPTRTPPLFPDFTDHGIDHIARVLHACDALLTNEARSIVTETDYCLLTVAAMYHDAAMHLTEDLFCQVIRETSRAPQPPTLTDVAWRDLWQAFVQESSRWDDRKWFQLLGSTSSVQTSIPTTPTSLACAPELLPPVETWTKHDRLFAGEFVRRHHARLGHEFIVSGVPQLNSDARRQIRFSKPEHAALCALIARSHAHDLRDMQPHLAYYGADRYGFDTCPMFLMGVLRIADFLDVEATRAPSSSLKVRTLCSPISCREWAAHNAIRDVKECPNDPEALEIIANPPNSRTFRRIEELICGLQSELDHTWAVYGETFGRDEHRRQLGLRLRRVKSNLKDQGFRERLSYFPGDFKFSTTDSDLLRNLVGPLYGHAIEVGVRELLQNSVDAVNELAFLCHNDAPLKRLSPMSTPEIRIELSKSDEECWLEIVDCGIGMDADIVRNFFLKAGASLRKSDSWKRDFVRSSRVQVIRTGRFGIGALGAFLLGNEMEVFTRKAGSPPDQGLHFRATIDDDEIEIKRITLPLQGTRIRIRLDEETYLQLAKDNGNEWDWFRWSTPRIERRIAGEIVHTDLVQFPTQSEELSPGWHRLVDSGVEDVVWTYTAAPRVVCNGIHVGRSASSAGHRRHIRWRDYPAIGDDTMPFEVPSIGVTDRDGRFPLQLQRDDVGGEGFPFEEQLLRDVARDFAAFCLVFAPHQQPFGGHAWPSTLTMFEYPGLSNIPQLTFAGYGHWFYTEQGVGFSHLYNLRRTQFTSATILLSLQTPPRLPVVTPEPGECIIYANMRSPIGVDLTPLALAQLLTIVTSRPSLNSHFFTTSSCSTVYIPDTMGYVYDSVQPQYDFQNVDRRIFNCEGGRKVQKWTHGRVANESSTLPQRFLEQIGLGLWIVAQLENPRVEGITGNPLTSTIDECLPSPVIPYSVEEREKQFAQSFTSLSDYIEGWKHFRRMNPYSLQSIFSRTTPGGGTRQL